MPMFVSMQLQSSALHGDDCCMQAVEILAALCTFPFNVYSWRISQVYNVNTYTHKKLFPGEFGIVYRGQLTGWAGKKSTELVAVKTLKGKKKR